MIIYYAKLYFLTLVAFRVIDGLWLGLIARGFYGKYLGFLLKTNPNWTAGQDSTCSLWRVWFCSLCCHACSTGLREGSLPTTPSLAS